MSRYTYLTFHINILIIFYLMFVFLFMKRSTDNEQLFWLLIKLSHVFYLSNLIFWLKVQLYNRTFFVLTILYLIFVFLPSLLNQIILFPSTY
jgi:hypothetical protein